MPNVTNFILGNQQVDIEDTVARSSASTAQTAAENAQTAASSAQTTANTAQTTANSAQSTANTAIENTNNNYSLITTANNNISRIKNLSNKNVVLIGDSYSVSSNSISTWSMLIQGYGVFNSVQRYQNTGAGFAVTNNLFQTILDNISTSDFSSIGGVNNVDLVVVCGGYNDRNYGRTEILTGIYNFVQASKAKFPNAEVMIGHIGWCTNSGQFSALRGSFQCYSQCSRYGAVYLNGVENIMRGYHTDFQDDGVHPNANGQTYLGTYIMQAICSGRADIIRTSVSANLSAGSGFTNLTWASEQYNDILYLNNTTSVNMTTSVAVTGNNTGTNQIYLGYLTSGYVQGNAEFNYPLPSKARVDGTWYDAIIGLKLQNSNVYMDLYIISDTGYVSGTMTGLIIPTFNMQLSSMFN